MHDSSGTHTRRHRGRALTVTASVLLGAALGLLGACGGSDAESDASVSAERLYSDAPSDEVFAADTADMAMAQRESADSMGEATTIAQAGADGSALAAPTGLTLADLGREIVYRATISVQADDVTAASSQAAAIVESLGGIVFSQTTRTEPSPTTEITFKVRPADFPTALDRLAGVGKLVDQSISADDVTERVVDLQSRISTAQTSVDRLRKLLEEADELSDVAQIEGALLDRETTLEVLRGQLRTLRDQVDLATITLTIHQSPSVRPESGIAIEAWISDDAEDPCLGSEFLSAEDDSTVYFCVEVENIGASTLTEVSLRSRFVRLDVNAFQPLRGSFDRIESGDLVAAVLEVPITDGRVAGRVATRALEIALEAEAVPVDDEGATLTEVSAETTVWLDVEIDEALPGFGDSVSDGAGFLRTVLGVALVVVGVLVPFLPFITVIVTLVWWRRRRLGPRSEREPKKRRTRARRKQPEPAAPPPPPAPAPNTEQE